MYFSNDLKLPLFLAADLLDQARRSPRTEICGLIGGHQTSATTIYPVTNTADHSERQFLLDITEQIAAMKTMRKRGETMVAVYHSHPDEPPEPSSHDVEGMSYPDAALLIISPSIHNAPKMRAWRIVDNRLANIRLNVTGTSSQPSY